MRGLNTTSNQSYSTRILTVSKKLFKNLLQTRSLSDLKKILLKSLPLEGLPLRIRPAFILLTFLSLLILSLLGFHPTLASKISPPIPFSDKLLHFICFSFASYLFYFIWDIEENSRNRIWWLNWFNELISWFICGFGSILSEFVQSLLPYKTFQFGDIIANLLGTSLGIFLARKSMKNYRIQLELNRLYRPVDFTTLTTSHSGRYDDEFDEDGEGNEEEDLLVGGGRENEMEEGRNRAETQIQNLSSSTMKGSSKNNSKRSEENPWDDGEEIFGIGEDELE